MIKVIKSFEIDKEQLIKYQGYAVIAELCNAVMTLQHKSKKKLKISYFEFPAGMKSTGLISFKVSECEQTKKGA